MNIKIYETNNEDIKRKSYIIEVNNFLYATRIMGRVINPINQFQEHILENFKNKIELKNYELLFNKKIATKIIENILITINFDKGFIKKSYFDIKRRKTTYIKENDDEKCLKTIYKELIKYIDLNSYSNDFIKRKEELEKKFNLL